MQQNGNESFIQVTWFEKTTYESLDGEETSAGNSSLDMMYELYHGNKFLSLEMMPAC